MVQDQNYDDVLKCNYKLKPPATAFSDDALLYLAIELHNRARYQTWLK